MSGVEGLRVSDLTVRFGGLVAVAGMSLEAPEGRITGLIGPNGAGKTTTFNACSGLNRPTGGTIELFGRVVNTLGPAARARLGLGRTFQKLELFDRLTVRDNVRLGREAALSPRRRLGGLLWATRDERREVDEAAADALTLCGIEHLADHPAGALSTGNRRLLELAMTLAGPFRLLLLDEPSSGLDSSETVRFAEILRTVRDERGTGILVVEHDMSLVRDVCEYVYVLDFGRPLFEGTMRDVLNSDLVAAAYLGSEVGIDELVDGAVAGV